MKIQALKVGQKVEHPKHGVYTVIITRINRYGDREYIVANDVYLQRVDHKDDIETGDIKVIKE